MSTLDQSVRQVGDTGADPGAGHLPTAEPAPVPGRPAAPGESRLYVLDLARLVAALMVMAYHLVAVAGLAWEGDPVDLFGPLAGVSKYGWMGVELFFLISGFVICMSAWGRGVGEFAISRVVRLFPAYWVAVLASALVVTIWPIAHRAVSGAEVAGNLTMIQRFFGIVDLDRSYWTLPIEMIFYLLFAVVIVKGLTYRRVVAFCGVWTVLSLAASYLNGLTTPVPGDHVQGISGVLDAGYSCYFVAGVLFFLIRRFGSNPLLWGLIGFSWLISLIRVKNTFVAELPMNYWVEVAIVTSFYLFMAAVTLGWFSWFRWRWAVTAGALTYPVYLIHQVIGRTVIKGLHPYVPHWVLLAALVTGFLLAAWLIHRLVERPASRWLKRHLTAGLHRLRNPQPRPKPARDARGGSRLLILDLARLGAALMVMSVHLIGGYRAAAWGAEPSRLFGPLDTLSHYGWLGVELFFLISGFVICMSAWGRTVGEFAVSRVVRLFPAYWVGVIVTAGVLTLWPVYHQGPGASTTIANLSMFNRVLGIRNVDPSYWTLLTEMIFYLLFMLVVARGLDYRRVLSFCLLWLLGSQMAPSLGIPGLETLLISEYSCYFVAGVLFYLTNRFGPNLLSSGMIGLCWLIALTRLPNWQIPGIHLNYVVEAVIVTAFFAFMTGAALDWFAWFRWRWAVTAGALTYPVYLIHQEVGLTVIKGLHPYVPHWILLVGTFAGLLLAAWLIHRLIERPASRWLKTRLMAGIEQFRTAGERADAPAPAGPAPVPSRVAGDL
ncbi:acyltransferase [Longispora sp. K20-0274]|uniref:acyltransferase family protein n=1 Tax=Longispora sp. K20-0274 TaxID=3088255 RepID=UPI0039994DA3